MTIEGTMDPMTLIVLGFVALMVVYALCATIVEIVQALTKLARTAIHGMVRVKVAKYRAVASQEHR